MKLRNTLIVFIVIYCLQVEAIIGSLWCFPPWNCNKNDSDASRLNLKNYVQSGMDIVTNVMENVPNILPKTTEIFSTGKNALFGLPFSVAFKAIHFFCSSALASNAIQSKYTPDITKMKFQLLSSCKREYIPLLDAKSLIKQRNFDVKKKVAIFVTGWTTRANDSMSIKWLAKAYRCRGDTNIIVLDAASFVDTLYTWSALNTEEIGMHLAEGLKLIADVVPSDKIHLIGHSLGAHIVGAAGRYFYYKTGKSISRITGLDPANPCFNEGDKLSGLMRGDAEFIDVIHSNSNALGKHDPLGDADFYPGGIVTLPPGCFTIECAHDRAWEYYVESVYPGNEENFMATRCTSLKSLTQGSCQSAAIPMGFAAPHNAVGTFVLNVNSESPFGEYSDKKRTLKHEKCGAC